MVVKRRASSVALALALAALAGFVLMPRLNEASAAAVREALSEFRARADAALGLSISFDALSPSILSSASFSGLSVKVPGGRPILVARKVRVLYNLFALIGGRTSEAVRGLELADVTLDLRLPEDEGLLDRLSALFSGEGGGGSGSVPRIIISGKNVAARVSVEGKGSASLFARDAGFSTLEDEPAVYLDGRFAVEPSGAGPWPVSGPVSLSGSISRDFKRGRIDLSLAAEARDFSLSQQRFEVVYGDDILSVTKVKDRAPLDASVRIGLAKGDASISVKLDGFVPSRSLQVSGRYAGLKPWLDMPYRGSISVEAEGPASLRYEARLSGFLPPSLLPGREAARAAVALRGDGESASIEEASLERGEERLEYRGSFRFKDLAPNGVLDVKLALADGRVPLSATVRLASQGGEYAVMADRVSAAGVDFQDLSITARRKGSQVDFKFSCVPPEAEGPDDEAETPQPASGRPAGASPPTPVPAGAPAYAGEAGASEGTPLVRCEGNASFGGEPSFELSFEFDSVDLGPMRNLIAAASNSPEAGDFISKVKVGGSLFASSDFKRLSWSAPDLAIVSRSSPGTYALLSLSGTATSVSIKRASVSIAGRTIEGQGAVDFADAEHTTFSAKLEVMDFPLAFQGRIDGGDISATGDYGLAVAVRDQGGEKRISFQAKSLPVPLRFGLYLASVEADGRFASLEDWFLSVSELELQPAGEGASALPKVTVAGDFGPRNAALSSIALEDKFSKLRGTASLSYSLSPAVSAQAEVRLVAAEPSPKGSAVESYRIDLAYSDGNLQGAADLTASPLARLGKLPLEGSVDGKATIRGSVSEPSCDFSAALRDGRLGDQSLNLSCSGSYGQGILELRGVKADYQGDSIAGGIASFSFRDAKAEAAFAFAGSFNGESLKFSVSARGAPTRSASRGTPAGRFSSYEAEGVMRDFALGKRTVDSWPFNFKSDAGAISFVGGASGELRFNMSADGLISASVRNPLPILPFNADLSCLYDGKNIDLSVQGLEFDLAALQPLMPDVVKLDGGKARGGFHAMGLAGDPEITGEVDVVGASVKVVGWVADDIGPFDAPIVAVGRRIDATVPAAPSGKALIALGFQASVDHWLPTGISAYAKTVQGTMLKLDSVILGVHAQGAAAADVRFTYPGGSTLRIDADVAIQSGTVVVGSEVLESGSEGEDSSPPSLYFDVATNVSFARGVQVFFPSTSFPIVAAYSDPSSYLSVLYDQAASDFSLKGTVALRGGEVFYVQRNFFLKNGKIVFNEGPDRFEPRVTLLAESRDRNDSGPVIITLKADNAPLTSFKPTLISDPPMSEADIAALMGQNLFGTDGERGVNLRTTAISASEFIPQLNVSRVLENKVRDAAGLDILYLRTQILQNWLIDMAQPRAETIDNPLARYFDRTSIYMGKYLNDSVFAYGSLGLRESTPLAGSSTSIINYDLGVELDAPFGRLTWALAPDDWKSLKFSDQSFTLSWKLSY